VSLALYSEGEKRMFYLGLANHIANGSDNYQTYAAILLLEYVKSIGSGDMAHFRSMLKKLRQPNLQFFSTLSSRGCRPLVTISWVNVINRCRGADVIDAL
jgi:hypothetical protein